MAVSPVSSSSLYYRDLVNNANQTFAWPAALTNNNVPGAVAIVILTIRTSGVTAFPSVTASIGNAAGDFIYQQTAVASGSGLTNLVAIAVRLEDLDDNVLRINWSPLALELRLVLQGFIFEGVTSAFDITDAIVQASGAAISGIDAPAGSALVVAGAHHTGAGADAAYSVDGDLVTMVDGGNQAYYEPSGVGTHTQGFGYLGLPTALDGEDVVEVTAKNFIPGFAIVLPPTAQAAFSASPEEGSASLEVTFTDESTGDVESWEWDFGDGSEPSTDQNPVHTYETAGTFTVTLTITSDDGESTATADIVVSPSFNCDCDDETDNETLGELRRRLLVRLGYAAQANNPPPGMPGLLDDFLRQSQRFLYRKYNELRTERIFSWQMTEGVRMYDLPANDDTCTKRLDPYKLTWVGVEDVNGAWYPLTQGIPPEFYTSVNFLGLPIRYEIRQCIEVFPAPSAPYTLRIKGHFKLTRFTEDDDKTTIDSELVFMWALARAKAHYGQSDAAIVNVDAKNYLGDLVAGKHGTARYVPGTSPAPPWTPPIFLPLQGE